MSALFRAALDKELTRTLDDRMISGSDKPENTQQCLVDEAKSEDTLGPHDGHSGNASSFESDTVLP